MNLMNKTLELESKMSTLENGLILKNIIQNIYDYRTLLSSSYETNDEKAYLASLNILYENCKNSIELLNNLCSVYGIDSIFRGDLNNKEEIKDFTVRFVISRLI